MGGLVAEVGSGSVTAPEDKGRRSRFRAYSLKELAAFPPPKVLVANAIYSGHLIAATGDPAFWRSFVAALGDGVVFLEDRTGSLKSRGTLIEQADVLRRDWQERDVPAVVIYCPQKGRNWEWFLVEASVAADAVSPTRAAVIKLRDFPDDDKELRIRRGRVLCVEAGATE